jgi:hypothetical protein
VILAVILAVGWMVVLGPSIVRRRSEHGGGVSSISHFHRQLSVLEHSSAAPLAPPAYRLQSVPRAATPRDATLPGVAPILTVVGADRLPRPALAFLGEPTPEDTRPPAHSASFRPRRSVDPYTRQLARQRRRDTLMVLSLVFVCSTLIGFIPGAGVIWVLSALSGVALAGYVAMLVHMRALADEREHKLRYLQPDIGAAGAEAFDFAATATEYDDSRYAHPAGAANTR